MKSRAVHQGFVFKVNEDKPDFTPPGLSRINANNAVLRRRSQEAAPKGQVCSAMCRGLFDSMVFFAACEGRQYHACLGRTFRRNRCGL